MKKLKWRLASERGVGWRAFAYLKEVDGNRLVNVAGADDWLQPREGGVEHGDIRLRGKFGLEGRLHFAIIDMLPVNFLQYTHSS